jgi:hypothetical protein
MILLIGNGPSGDTQAVADAIKMASRVLRMNNWQPGRHTGDRCDIWGTSFNVDIAKRPSADEVWWTGWPYGRCKECYADVLAKQTNRYTRVASRSLITKAFSRTKKEPSTGIILALMAATKVGDTKVGDTICLAGYDHFLGPQHHSWTSDPAICDPLEFHDPESERLILAGIGARIIS